MNPIEALMETATPLQRKLLEGCRYVPETGCWEWVGNSHGGIYDTGNRKFSARTKSFEEFIGPLMWDDIAKINCGNRKCICPAHMTTQRSYPKEYWTKERCAKEAKKYKTRSEFRTGSGGALTSARKNGWLEEICAHMPVRVIHRREEITKEDCAEAALNYDTRGDFEKGYNVMYRVARENGWLDDICDHMVQFSKPRGYWTKETCREEASRYTTVKDFRANCDGAYLAAHSNGWLSEICSHMVRAPNPNKKWTKEKCAEEARKYDRKVDFKKFGKGAVAAARENGWYDEITSHMDAYKPGPLLWTKDAVKAEAMKYKHRKDFQDKSGGAYAAASRNKWLNEVCSHMEKPEARVKYTREVVESAAKACANRTDFLNNSRPFYDAAKRNGWLDEFFPKPA